MKYLAIFALVAGFAVLTECAPQYGGHGGNQRQRRKKCRFINDVKYVEEYDTKCTTSYE